MESFATTILPFILSVLSVILSVVMHLLDEKYAYICLVAFILTVIASYVIFYIVIADLYCNNWRTAAVVIQICVWIIVGVTPPFLGVRKYELNTPLKGVDEDVLPILFFIISGNAMLLMMLTIASIY